MLVTAVHLLTGGVTLSKSYEFPGTGGSIRYRGSLPDVMFHDSKDYNLPCNLISFLKAGPIHRI